MTPPPVIRFEGVPADSPELDQLRRQFAPQIGHFHRSQAQKYSLSLVENYRAHGVYPGLRMTYTNLQGQETINIQVTALGKGRISEQPTQPPWDWVVLDIIIPQFLYTYNGDSTPSSTSAEFFAKLIAPPPSSREPRPRPEAEYGEAGENSDAEYYSAELKPILQWAYTSLEPQVGELVDDSDAIEMGSLLIDMREFHTYEEMVIELYVGNETMSDDFNIVGFGAPTYYGYIQLADTPATLVDTTGPVPIGTPNPYTDYRDESAVPTDLPNHGLGDAWPASGVDIFTGLLVLVDEGFDVVVPQGTSVLQTYSGPTGPWTWEFYESASNYVFAPESSYEYVSFPITPVAAAELRAVMIRGDFEWAWSAHQGPNFIDFGRWEDARVYPQRFATARLAGDVSIATQGEDDSRANNYGLSLIGRLSVSPKRGGFSFNRV